MLIGILEHEHFSEEALSLLDTLGKVIKFETGDINKFLRDLDVLFIRLNYYIGNDFLKKCKNLKYVCSPTTGLIHIDLNILAKKNISLISLRGEKAFLKNVHAAAEHTFCLILSLLRGMNIYNNDIKAHNWNRMLFLGDELNCKKIGIIGFGRIGCKVSQYLTAFGAEISWYDPYIDPKNNKFYQYKSLTKLIEYNEIIVLTASVKNSSIILDENEIKLFEGKYFVNISRGELVNEEAFIKLLKKDLMAGFATDVISNENFENNLKKFVDLSYNRNLLITPHIGGATKISLQKTELFIANQLKKIILS